LSIKEIGADQFKGQDQTKEINNYELGNGTVAPQPSRAILTALERLAAILFACAASQDAG